MPAHSHAAEFVFTFVLEGSATLEMTSAEPIDLPAVEFAKP